jgi:hypothetical protein
VPSPSALVVLPVLAYGLGMAAMLTSAGLLLVSLRDRFGSRLARFRRFADFTPLGTAALVMLVGVGLATHALAGWSRRRIMRKLIVPAAPTPTRAGASSTCGWEPRRTICAESTATSAAFSRWSIQK